MPSSHPLANVGQVVVVSCQCVFVFLFVFH
jgi:hypothetical protein